MGTLQNHNLKEMDFMKQTIKKNQKNKNPIAEWINQILVHKKPWDSFKESDKKLFSPFIINRWLSMDEDFIEIVNYFQKYTAGTLKNREIYNFYREVLPRGKRYNKYIKDTNKKYEPELLNILCIHFECSTKQVKEFLKILVNNELKLILSMYGIDNKTIRKLIK